MEARHTGHHHEPWNKGKLVGQKAPLKLKEIWAIRVRLQMQRRMRELALFNVGIDSKLRACDLVSLRVRDVCHGDHVAARAVVLQHKTQRPVQFEITPPTREAVDAWIRHAGLKAEDCLFPSRVHRLPHLGTRQYGRIVDGWVEEIGLDPAAYGSHSMRRTEPTFIYRRTKNLRAVQLLLGHTKLESTVRYLGIEVDDALEIAEQTEAYKSAVTAVIQLRCDRNAPALGQALAAKSGPPPILAVASAVIAPITRWEPQLPPGAPPGSTVSSSAEVTPVGLWRSAMPDLTPVTLPLVPSRRSGT